MSHLFLQKIKVENATADAGIVYGFPPPSAFLGFAHSLERRLKGRLEMGTLFRGVAIVAHGYQLQRQEDSYRKYKLKLMRQPLKADGKSPPFIEESRIHMEVSMVLDCSFDEDDIDLDDPLKIVREEVERSRIAGGIVTRIKDLQFFLKPEDDEDPERARMDLLRKMCPGYVLLDRTDLLKRHYQNLIKVNPSKSRLDALLDFCTWKKRVAYEPPSKGKKALLEETLLDAPAKGWFVPISAGYAGISDLYDAGDVRGVRDPEVPFRFVESIYTLGQWSSPYRVERLESLFWKYDVSGEFYICRSYV